MGHQERFPQTRMSAGCGFRKETIVGMRRNERDAPRPDLRATSFRLPHPLRVSDAGPTRAFDPV